MNAENDKSDDRTDETENCLDNFKQRFEKKIQDPKFALELAGFIVLCIYAFFTLLMYCANKKAADAAKKSADISEATLVASNRPWVSGSFEISKPPSIQGNTVELEYIATLKNSGHAPATNVEISSVMAFVGGSAGPITWGINQNSCPALGRKYDRGDTVFPGEPRELVTQPTSATIPEPSLRPLAIMLQICIDYQWTGFPEHHQTLYTCIVGKGRSGDTLAFDNGRPIIGGPLATDTLCIYSPAN